MKTTGWARRFVITILLTLVVPIVLFAPQAYAESYVAGQLGVTLPSISGGLTDNELTGVFPPGSTISDQSLKTSVLYGAKVGHYFRAAPWLGLEAEVYNTTPDIKQQDIVFSGPSGPIGSVNLPSVDFRVLTLAPLNLTLRYHKKRLQPYIAVGPGIFFARIKDPSITSDNTQSDTTFGLNAQVGLRYYVTRHFTVFGQRDGFQTLYFLLPDIAVCLALLAAAAHGGGKVLLVAYALAAGVFMTATLGDYWTEGLSGTPPGAAIGVVACACAIGMLLRGK